MQNPPRGRWGMGRTPPSGTDDVTTVDTDPAEPSSGAPVGATLEVLSGPDEGTTHILEANDAILGRADDAQVRFSDASISRHHVRIQLVGGVYSIRELGSSNGTQLDGRPVRGTVNLRPRCRIRLGKRTAVEFTAMDSAGLRRAWHRLRLEARLDLERSYSQMLTKQASQLRDALHDLEQFASVASHDLRAPLHTVGSLAELLAMQYGDQLDDKAHQYISLMVDGIHRMDRLIGDLRDWSRIRKDGQAAGIVSLDDALDDALANLRTAIADSGARVEREALPVVVGHRGQLTQLLQNLLANAIKFRADAPPLIRVTSTQDGTDWVVSVSDQGIGLDMRQGDRIFELFQRLHRDDEYPGTGIGLAIAKRVADLHNGRIWVESRVGEGTTFHIALPDHEGDVDSARDTLDPDDDDMLDN